MRSDLKEIKKKRGIGISFAINGLKEIIKTERNVKIHTIIAVIVILFGAYFGLSRLEWGIIILVIGTVFSFEVMNAAIERILDYLAPEIHPMVGIIKDISAGAVLVSAATSVVVGLLIFIPKLLQVLL